VLRTSLILLVTRKYILPLLVYSKLLLYCVYKLSRVVVFIYNRNVHATVNSMANSSHDNAAAAATVYRTASTVTTTAAV
jgi:hypothetical protein